MKKIIVITVIMMLFAGVSAARSESSVIINGFEEIPVDTDRGALVILADGDGVLTVNDALLVIYHGEIQGDSACYDNFDIDGLEFVSESDNYYRYSGTGSIAFSGNNKIVLFDGYGSFSINGSYSITVLLTSIYLNYTPEQPIP